jgi:tetratricopeptide (TPR) repeat protein
MVSVPYREFAVQQAKSSGHNSIVHSYGALQCLERLLRLLRDGGFVLMNDYGQAQAAEAEGFEHQRFSDATFVGVNFHLLKNYFTNSGEAQWEEPKHEEARILSRLLGKRVATETMARFQVCFSKETQEWQEAPVHRAREWAKHGRLGTAATAYAQALERQPYNWILMNEAAHLLTFPLGNPYAGLEMARAALACNPNCSAELWSMAGDSLFAVGRVEEAKQAYQRALRINPDDPLAHLNLAFVYTKLRQYSLALQQVAKALTVDRTGTYREGLLQQQSEILARLGQRHQQHYQRMADRVSTAPGQHGG